MHEQEMSEKEFGERTRLTINNHSQSDLHVRWTGKGRE
jgi:hypothetical protein